LLVVAPDRGFMGDQEIEDAFAGLAARHNAELVFVTDERAQPFLDRALERLVKRGARKVVVLPLFLSEADPRFQRAQKLFAQAPELNVPVSFGGVFGQSYLAVETLADRLRGVRTPAGTRVIVVGSAGTDVDSRRRLESDAQRMAEQAARGFGFESVRAIAWDEREGKARLAAAATGAERVAVVPFHLAQKFDSMMTFEGGLELPERAELVVGDVTPHPALGLWMLREATRHSPLRAEDVGVVFLAHGADFHWNDGMRTAVAGLGARYKLEFAFCMADQPVVERAVRRLEQRGARAIVVVRVFGLESSFRGEVERMLGLDVEQPSSAHAGHGHGPGPASAEPSARIRSSAPMVTVGGLEAHALFAGALLERARELSRDPARETLILVAHGAGEDARNDHWLGILQALARRMRAAGGDRFRAIEVATWREDWPDKREPWIKKVRGLVEDARKDGGKAIVVPARTSAEGPERELLAGLDFELGRGFAPHPLFERWVEEQILSGIRQLKPHSPARAGEHHDHH
jgi:sirohydrochlorin ferrochelatase